MTTGWGCKGRWRRWPASTRSGSSTHAETLSDPAAHEARCSACRSHRETMSAEERQELEAETEPAASGVKRCRQFAAHESQPRSGAARPPVRRRPLRAAGRCAGGQRGPAARLVAGTGPVRTQAGDDEQQIRQAVQVADGLRCAPPGPG